MTHPEPPPRLSSPTGQEGLKIVGAADAATAARFSTSTGVGIITESVTKSDDGSPLAAAIRDVRDILIYSHLNPDPDTIGAALGLRQILAERFEKNVSLCYRGMVGRAENREMVRLLVPDFTPARELDQGAFDGAFLLDAQPAFGLVPGLDQVPLIGVIDHHPEVGPALQIPLVDIRPHYGATSTIITEYLRAEALAPPAEVATGLFYGIKTDTQDLSRRTSPADIDAYNWLLPQVDRDLLGKIENPPLSRDYFETMVAAISRSITYQQAVLTEIGVMPYPDMVAEIADRLIHLQEIDWSICFGMHDQRIYFSVRTRSGRDAGDVVREVLGSDGVGGGHDAMAAGRVQLLEESEETYIRVVSDLWRRFLDVLGEDSTIGRRLVGPLDTPARIPV